MLLRGILPIHLLLFFPFFLLAISYYRFRYDLNPPFDLETGFERSYSAARLIEAQAFINASATKPFRRTAPSSPFLCIGMLTLARPSADVYFRDAIASLLAGLTQEERDELYVIPFVTHTDPKEHPVYGEAWLDNVVDRLLTYGTSKIVTTKELDHIKDLEAERKKTQQPDREKHLFDYSLLMKTCAAEKASYVAMFEDDILALDGWYHRTKSGLQEIERVNKEKGVADFFYLRLFYFGEEQNDLPIIIAKVAFVATVLVILLRKTPLGRQKWFIIFPAAITVLTLGITLFMEISRGRLQIPTVQEVTEGCCAQGIVYPITTVRPLTDWYAENRIGFVDSLAEKLVNEKPAAMGSRWALRPAVLQHVGTKSSKGDNWGSDKPGEMSAAQKIWNFEFERNEPAKLAAEHRLADLQRRGKPSAGV